MTSTNKDRRTVKTTETTFAILELLKKMDGARVAEVANRLEVADSTAHRHLATLEQLEYVVKEGDLYQPSLQFLELGAYVQKRKEAYVMAEPMVEELAEETEERAHFITEEHGQGVYVHRKRGKHAVRTDPGVGKTIPLHATASGKAILAYMPEIWVQQIIESKGLPAISPKTITSCEELFKQLETIQEQEVAFNKGEYVEGERAVAAPIRGADNRVIGALNVVGPSHRMKGSWFEQEIPDLLRGSANELELNIAYS